MNSDNNDSFDWDSLLEGIGDQRVIPIVGRELLIVSVDGQQVLLEHHLARCLAEELKVSLEGLPTEPELNDVAQQYMSQSTDRNKIYSKLKRLMARQQLSVPEPLLKLAEITHFNLFVTLTFDDLLARAVSQVRFQNDRHPVRLRYTPKQELQDLPKDGQDLDTVYVYHLFGELSSAADYAVVDEDYLEFVHCLQTSKRPVNLFDRFRDNHLLFLGCGFENWLQRFLIRTILNQSLRDSRDTTEFVADPEAREGRSLTSFLQQYRTQVFTPGDPVRFISELHERWSAEFSRNPAEKAESARSHFEDEPCMVFISYASEDGDAARNIVDSLEDAVDGVWFDKQALQAGDDWDQVINRKISSCAVFIALISRHSDQRREGYYRQEWQYAIKRKNRLAPSVRFILPVVIDDTQQGSEGIPSEFWKAHAEWLEQGCMTPEFVATIVETVRSSQLERRHN